MLCTFQFGIAMGQPEIISLGASFAVNAFAFMYPFVKFVAEFVDFCSEAFYVVIEADLDK